MQDIALVPALPGGHMLRSASTGVEDELPSIATGEKVTTEPPADRADARLLRGRCRDI